jgi:hypothetical protein
MTAIEICVGCILHWKGFIFADGGTADKYLVIVGAHPGMNYLAIVATSKQKKRSNEPGGNPQGGYYHIPGGGKDWFPKDTWLLFEEPREISAAEMVKEGLQGNIEVKGRLRHDIANAICNCMRKCEDVSELHIGLLGPPAQPPPKVA